MSRSFHSKHKRFKEFWSRRPMRYFISSKWSKVKCHRIERTQAKDEIVKELKQL